jgi:tetratricopeptide (TPR) repeat protein
MSIDIEKLNTWHESGMFQKIIDAVEALPLTERDYEIVSQYARALNSCSRYEEALVQFDIIREQAQSDAYWHFRYGYSLFYLDREVESIPYFERAIELGDDWPETYEMLQWAKEYEEKTDDENDSEGNGNTGDFEPQAFATLFVNMRLRPDDRYERIERSIELFLQAKGIGCVSGGGTLVNEYGEPENCDIEIDLNADTDEVREALITAANRLSIAKGSKLIYRSAGDDAERAEYPIGKMSGLAI